MPWATRRRAYPVIHITGTNGKGSVARMCTELLLEAAGLSVGTYTSPHLEAINERISWNGEPIDDDALAGGHRRGGRGRGPLVGITPSYFEILTAAAFTHFADVAVDVAVVEVGMLGRYDATNVVDAQVAVLTNIGHDHTDGVGEWRQAIAGEKVGIVKPGSTFVCGETDPDLRPLLEATEAAATWWRGEDFDCEQEMLALGGRAVSLRTPSVHGRRRVRATARRAPEPERGGGPGRGGSVLPPSVSIPRWWPRGSQP
jgi:dihydrofolate synthase/folylpolyglutamate synthase